MKSLGKEKVEFTLKTHYTYGALDSMSLCQFVFGAGWQLYTPVDMANFQAAATGWDVDVDEVQLCGQRRTNLMRAYNLREGLTRADDMLPQKLFKKALEGGRSDGILLERGEIEQAIDMYYDQAGWDAEGVPTRETLESIDLGWVADDMGW